MFPKYPKGSNYQCKRNAKVIILIFFIIRLVNQITNTYLEYSKSADQEILDRREQLLDEELDKFINGIDTSKYRPKSTTWMSI